MAQSLSDRAYDYILELIFSQVLQDGAKIYEQTIMDALKISRTPVREAVQRLVSDHILDYFPHRYTQVHTFTDREIFDLATVRISIDSLAVQLAILNGSNRDFQYLAAVADQCDAAGAAGDVSLRIQHDCTFHTELVRVGGNQVLMDLQKRLSLKTRAVQTQSYNKHRSLFCNAGGHRVILEALYARDAAQALAAVDSHLRPFYAQLLGDADSKAYSMSPDDLPLRIPVYGFTDFSMGNP